ncbi:low-affinity cAMP phosphodiesterase [Rhexocercosporidium sp. MPI-PUGE-AT-0058]|nr:low-affinity cAMP phosphodiesterase [Rhexocercosporidium sp. MPI-PUGE-AT-0058]
MGFTGNETPALQVIVLVCIYTPSLPHQCPFPSDRRISSCRRATCMGLGSLTSISSFLSALPLSLASAQQCDCHAIAIEDNSSLSRGSGGGPLENNVTALLVRAPASGWKSGSILQVDGGVGLASIAQILSSHKQNRPFADERSSRDGAKSPVTLIKGPFEGLEIPKISPGANAKYIYQELIDTVLITHPHIDHIMGAIVNTATPAPTRQKHFVGLPHTIELLKKHIFNNAIWPNLTDENNGAGLISYTRLVEGGTSASGQGDSKGFVEIAPDLGVKAMSISHGTCIDIQAHPESSPLLSPSVGERSRLPSPLSNSQKQRSNSNPSIRLEPGIPRTTGPTSHSGKCVYNSSVFFIRDSATGKEILVFGDVEPDSVSLSPRNRLVWAEAAPKIASGQLTGIFIECSYDESRPNDQLFGHLKPSYLIEELKVLAGYVSRSGGGSVNTNTDKHITSPKRKRVRNGSGSSAASETRQLKTPRQQSPQDLESPPRSPSTGIEYPILGRKPAYSRRRNAISGASRDGSPPAKTGEKVVEKKPFWPLKGLKVVIMHVKESLDDGPPATEIIQRELRELEEEAALGCDIIVSHPGQSFYF